MHVVWLHRLLKPIPDRLRAHARQAHDPVAPIGASPSQGVGSARDPPGSAGAPPRSLPAPGPPGSGGPLGPSLGPGAKARPAAPASWLPQSPHGPFGPSSPGARPRRAPTGAPARPLPNAWLPRSPVPAPGTPGAWPQPTGRPHTHLAPPEPRPAPSAIWLPQSPGLAPPGARPCPTRGQPRTWAAASAPSGGWWVLLACLYVCLVYWVWCWLALWLRPGHSITSSSRRPAPDPSEAGKRPGGPGDAGRSGVRAQAPDPPSMAGPPCPPGPPEQRVCAASPPRAGFSRPSSRGRTPLPPPMVRAPPRPGVPPHAFRTTLRDVPYGVAAWWGGRAVLVGIFPCRRSRAHRDGRLSPCPPKQATLYGMAGGYDIHKTFA